MTPIRFTKVAGSSQVSRARGVIRGLPLGGRPALALIAAAGLLALLPALARMHDAVSGMDEGQLLVYPERLLAGEVPGRDFNTVYGPGVHWLLAGAYALLGPSVAVERAVGLLLRAAIVVATGWLAGRSSLRAGLGGAVLCGLWLSCVAPVAQAWFAALAGALVATAALVGATRRAGAGGAALPALAGLAAAFALTCRIEFVVPVGLAAAALWPALDRRARRAFLLAALVGLVPLAIHIAVVSPTRVLDNWFTGPVLRSSPARRLPLVGYGGPARNATLLALMAAIAVLLWAGVRRLRAAAPRDAGARASLAVAALSLGLLPYALQRTDLSHLRHAGCVPLALLPAALGELASRPGRRRARLEWDALLAVGVLTLASRSTEEYRALRLAPDPVPVEHAGRTLYVAASLAGDLRALLAWLDEHVPASSRLFIGPRDLDRPIYNDTALYFLLPDLRPASWHLELNPGDADREDSGLAEDVATADVVVLTGRYDAWREPNASARRGSGRAGSVVSERFEVAESFGPWDVYRRREATAAGRQGP